MKRKEILVALVVVSAIVVGSSIACMATEVITGSIQLGTDAHREGAPPFLLNPSDIYKSKRLIH